MDLRAEQTKQKSPPEVSWGGAASEKNGFHYFPKYSQCPILPREPVLVFVQF
jgi:hypothetical protein